jgi:hypothetical protein
MNNAALSYVGENHMHIDDFCQISNFLIRNKFKMKFLGRKIVEKIFRKIKIRLFFL